MYILGFGFFWEGFGAKPRKSYDIKERLENLGTEPHSEAISLGLFAPPPHLDTALVCVVSAFRSCDSQEWIACLNE